MLRLVQNSVVVLALWTATIGVAEAHAHLTKSVPAASSKVAGPSEIRLQFSEAVEPRFSQISIEAKTGSPIPGQKVSVDPGDKTVLVLKLSQALKPGIYNVDWRVVSVDTHKVRGSFTFEVQP